MRGMMANLAMQNGEYTQILARSGVEPADLSGGAGKPRRDIPISRGVAHVIARETKANPQKGAALMRKVKDSKNPTAFARSVAAVKGELKAIENAPPPSRQDMEYVQAVRMSGVNPASAERQQARPVNRHVRKGHRYPYT